MTSVGPLTYRPLRYRSGASGSSPVPVDESQGLLDDYLTGPSGQLGLLMMGHRTAREAAAFVAKIGGMTPWVSTLLCLTRTMHGGRAEASWREAACGMVSFHDARIVAIADGAADNWTFLETLSPETEVIDFWHAC